MHSVHTRKKRTRLTAAWCSATWHRVTLIFHLTSIRRTYVLSYVISLAFLVPSRWSSLEPRAPPFPLWHTSLMVLCMPLSSLFFLCRRVCSYSNFWLLLEKKMPRRQSVLRESRGDLLNCWLKSSTDD